MYFFLKAFSFYLRNAPTFAYNITYKIIYSLLFHVLKIRQKVVLTNLRWAFPNKEKKWYKKTMKLCYKFYTKEFLDFLSFPRYYKNSKINFSNFEVLSNALNKKNGVILLGSHFGSFDKLFYAMNEKGVDLTGVAYKQNNRGADLFFKKIREKFINNQLYKGGDARLLNESLSQNNVLILLSDQDAKNKGVNVKFFSIDSSTHSGAAILSKRNKCPLIYSSITKVDGSYEVEFDEINTNNSIENIVQSYTLKIEKTITKSPEQYFWFHKRWKSVRKY